MCVENEISDKNSWKSRLKESLSLPVAMELCRFLRSERSSGKQIYPPRDEVFSALELCPFEQVRVVILGQDPYHGPDQAHGLAFSVRTGQKMPPSLRNIYREIQLSCGGVIPSSGDLTHWAQQGVLLLNTVLTVEAGKAASHRGRGWEVFTDAILERLNREKSGLVFVLWGADAQAKAGLIDSQKHLILAAPHPSPLSAYRGFFGCGHFVKINKWLNDLGAPEIKWFPT